MNEDEQRLINTALDWRAKLDDADVNSAMRDAFQDWLAENPRHGAAYDHAARFWRGLDALGRDNLDEVFFQPSFAERCRMALDAFGRRIAGSVLRAAPIAGACAVAAFALAFIFAPLEAPTDIAAPPETEHYAYATGIGEIQGYELEDGSMLTLGAGSAADVRFSGGKRSVTLKEGDAFFDIVRERDRPFEVIAGDMTARVLGTSFDVRLNVRSTELAVAEGAVEVYYSRAPGGEAKEAGNETQPSNPVQALSYARLTAGDRVIGSLSDGLGDVTNIGQGRVGAWRDNRLVYFDAPLAEIIADINRYHDAGIILADDSLADLRISAAFDSSDIDGMLATLSELFALRLDKAPDGAVSIYPA